MQFENYRFVSFDSPIWEDFVRLSIVRVAPLALPVLKGEGIGVESFYFFGRPITPLEDQNRERQSML